MFLFSGPAKFHFIDVHPEIIFVAAVRGVENAVLSEAHRLHVIEAGAASRISPDGMTPIEHPSFRNRCERHSAPPP
jgi:hypothetical protein